MADRLKGKVAIVFGAGRQPDGLSNGAAAAIAFAREGARVACIDISPDAAHHTAELILHEGFEAAAFSADVTSAAEVAASVQAAVAMFGRLDILHNNVGLNSPGGPVDLDEAVWDRIMATNAKSLFLTCKSVIPHMIRGCGGAIINISSIAGVTFYGRPTIAYSASKAAVNQFTRAVAAQHGPDNIRCNAILAGTIDSPRSQRQLGAAWNGDFDEMRRRRAWAVPLRRLGTPWDVANAAVFLASEEASFISGAILAVDGALTCAAPNMSPD